MGELIIGVHSIAHALMNKNRNLIKLYANEEGKVELQKKYSLLTKDFPSEILKNHHLQEKGKELFQKYDQTYSRLPSGLLLETNSLEERDPNWLNEKISTQEKLKILCLDQITDIHNGAAIFRTAAFYGVNVIMLPQKGSFSLTPGFFRISSGAREHIEIVRVASFPKVIKKLSEKGVEVIALSEHAKESELEPAMGHRLLVLGAEETGISHALLRVIEKQVSLASRGPIASLNVSVASALAMDKSFS